MPGCTAPFCSNSSQKGYKLYHFPSDIERCGLWIKNCGREEGWKPTRHTCLCEVHFEESEFESHRADGLRKLKPFAVPTKFDQDTGTRRRKKTYVYSLNTEQNPQLMENRKTESETMKTGISSKDIGKFAVNDPQAAKIHIPQTAKVHILQSAKVKSQGTEVSKSQVASSSNVNTSSKSAGLEEMCFAKTLNTNTSQVLEESSTEIEKIEAILPASETDNCFICSSKIQKRVPLKTCTETSKTCLDQKLVYLIAEEFDLLVEDSSVICTMCAQILNCIDYVESVFCTLSKGILNLMRRKFRVPPRGEIDLQLYIKNLRNLSDFYVSKSMDEVNPSGAAGQRKSSGSMIPDVNYTSQCSKSLDVDCSAQSSRFSNMECTSQSEDTFNQDCSNQSSKTSDQENTNQSTKPSDEEDSNQSSKIDSTQEIKENNESEKSIVNTYKCQMCSYKAQYKALMIYHIRQHYQKLFSCDFCTNPVILDSKVEKEKIDTTSAKSENAKTLKRKAESKPKEQITLSHSKKGTKKAKNSVPSKRHPSQLPNSQEGNREDGINVKKESSE